VLKKHNVVCVRIITCGLGSGLLERYTACVFRRLSEAGGSVFIQNSIYNGWFGVCMEGHNFSALWFK
jgi:hypothetical protein